MHLWRRNMGRRERHQSRLSPSLLLQSASLERRKHGTISFCLSSRRLLHLYLELPRSHHLLILSTTTLFKMYSPYEEIGSGGFFGGRRGRGGFRQERGRGAGPRSGRPRGVPRSRVRVNPPTLFGLHFNPLPPPSVDWYSVGFIVKSSAELRSNLQTPTMTSTSSSSGGETPITGGVSDSPVPSYSDLTPSNTETSQNQTPSSSASGTTSTTRSILTTESAANTSTGTVIETPSPYITTPGSVTDTPSSFQSSSTFTESPLSSTTTTCVASIPVLKAVSKTVTRKKLPQVPSKTGSLFSRILATKSSRSQSSPDTNEDLDIDFCQFESGPRT